MKEIEIDSFAGGGGASAGIERATGRSPYAAINHSHSAIEMHTLNHPRTHHYEEDVWLAEPNVVTDGKPVGLLWSSPDCFPAGTLVLTRTGLKPIEQVEAAEYVLTHKNRWRRVVSTMNKVAPTVSLRGHGHWGLVTTPEHQIYSKRVTKRYPGRGPDGRRPGTLRTLVENPYWPAAQEMAGKLWATPRMIPPTPMPLCDGAEFTLDFFYFLGRWVGDGSLNKGDVEICCGTAEVDELKEIFSAHPLRNAAGETLPWRIVDHGSSQLLVWGNARLVDWLREQFGDSCETKRIPAWLLGAQASWQRAFLDGYVDADGHVHHGIVETSSVSRALSVGVRLLAVSLGYSPTMYLTAGMAGQIEGREFIAKDVYRVRWRQHLQVEQCHRDKKHLFSPVREVIGNERDETVYCLEVEEDESYTADGIVVHNCKHFSLARGAKPADKRIRSLAWVVVRWARKVRPRVIMLENVREFESWAPLIPVWQCLACGDWRGTEGQAKLARRRRRCPRCNSVKLERTKDELPDPGRKGLLFKTWVGCLQKLGYDVQWRNLDAADYGAPTHRKRLFLIARCDGEPIVWPKPTHADKKKAELLGLRPYRTAAECIDWSIPCRSIFDRKKPLAEKTLRRIALGLYRYVLKADEPFIVDLAYGDNGRWGDGVHRAEQPLGTIHAGGKNHATVAVSLTQCNHGGEEFRGQSVEQPMPTLTASRDAHGLTAAYLAKLGQTGGNGAYTNSVEEPLTTIVSKNEQLLVAPILAGVGGSGYSAKPVPADKPSSTVLPNDRRALVTALLAKHYTGVVGQSLEQPLGTITAIDHHSLVTGNVVKFRGDSDGRPLDQPLPTVTAGEGAARPAGAAHAMGLAAANIMQLNYDMAGQPVTDPLHTITSTVHYGVVAANIARFNHGEKQWSAADEPLGTVTAQGLKFGLVYAFLVKYYGTAIGQDAQIPLFTATGVDRFGVVMVQTAQGLEPGVAVQTIHGPMVITDIGLRMLEPRELARAQGFDDSYKLLGSKSNQVAKIGNSVCPVMAEVLVRANYKPRYVRSRRRESMPELI